MNKSIRSKNMCWVGAIVFFAIVFTGTSQVEAWGSSEKVKLTDVQVLTLYNGQMTAGRRSKGVPQLMCVGGNAGCGTFTPQVVQCYNRGSDGFDVQWECKTDMDNAYRFGKVDVTCEGYDYPDDPYVLRGSCGLEYTLDLTKEGMAGQGGQHNYYGAGGGQKANSYGWNPNVYPQHGKGSSTITNLACAAVVLIIVYAIYKTCIAPVDHTSQRSRTNDDYSDPRGPGSQPPPPGFRPGYSSGSSDFFSGGGDSCAGSSRGASAGTGTGGAGGFWTGVATGGLLGYLFGNRNDSTGAGYGYTGYSRPRTSYGFGGAVPSTSYDSWGGSSSSGFGSGSSSTGTRTASGFGGTRRR